MMRNSEIIPAHDKDREQAVVSLVFTDGIPPLLLLKKPAIFLSNSFSFNTFGGTIDKILNATIFLKKAKDNYLTQREISILLNCSKLGND